MVKGGAGIDPDGEQPASGEPLTDEQKSIVIFQADRKVRFEDIDKVMKTAAMAGFPNFRFAVMKK